MGKTLISKLLLSTAVCFGLTASAAKAQIASPLLQPFQLIRGSTPFQTTSGTSLVCPFPAGASVGDLVVGAMGSFNTAFSVPSGWTIFNQRTQGFWSGAYFWKTLASGDISTGSVTLTVNDGAAMLVDIVPLSSSSFNFTNNASTSNPSTSVLSAGSPNSSRNIFIFIASYTGSTAPTITDGSSPPFMNFTLLQNTTAFGSLAVYVSTGSNQGWNVTCNYGTYTNGYYCGYATIMAQ